MSVDDPYHLTMLPDSSRNGTAWKYNYETLRNVRSAPKYFVSNELGDSAYEVCSDRRSSRSDYSNRHARVCPARCHQPGLLRSVLSERQLPELWAGQPLHRQLSGGKLG